MVSVTLNGLRFSCRLDGENAAAPWLVFSNSLATNVTVWNAQVEALAGRFRILRYDQRGHGRTEVPTEPYGLADLGRDAHALLDRFEIERCAFVGLSMGVPTALQLLADCPGRIERLVLCDGQAQTAANGARSWDERIAFAREAGMDAVADVTVKRWFGADFVASGKAEAMRRMIAATPLEGYVGGARALKNYAYAAVLPKIAVPALLIAGARDGAIPEAMRAMSRSITGARMVEIPDAGHIPNVEQAGAFNRVLDEFLAAT
ncbi:MAG TPA: alpha/beta fold hydrolase [Pararhizobium sp.]|nr:alpha/beta fold hydrolase [Pararhizobium sp.]